MAIEFSRYLVSCGIIIAVGTARLEAAAPTIEYALGLRPSQKDVDYDRPDGEAAKNAIVKTEMLGGVSAFVVRGPGGKILRVFADTNADRVVDRWSYFKDGVEVFQDIDSNFNQKVDQMRWHNRRRNRWGIDADENGVIESWKAEAELLADEPTTPEAQSIVKVLLQQQDVWLDVKQKVSAHTLLVPQSVWEECMRNLVGIRIRDCPQDFRKAWEEYLVATKDMCDHADRSNSPVHLTAVAVKSFMTAGLSVIEYDEENAVIAKRHTDAVLKLAIIAKRYGVE